MAKVKRYTATDGAYHGELGFYCPGCRRRHFIYDKETKGHTSPMWEFNNDFDKPTVSPSIFVNRPGKYHCPTVPSCHSFIIDGKIKFLSDSTHEFAGQTVELPEIV